MNIAIRKLTPLQAWMIKFGHPGISNYKLASMYKVSRETTGKIRLGKSWKHLTEKHKPTER